MTEIQGSLNQGPGQSKYTLLDSILFSDLEGFSKQLDK